MLNMFETLSLSCNKKSKKNCYEWSTLHMGNGFDILDDVLFFNYQQLKHIQPNQMLNIAYLTKKILNHIN
jgi:hypothetical protein